MIFAMGTNRDITAQSAHEAGAVYSRADYITCMLVDGQVFWATVKAVFRACNFLL